MNKYALLLPHAPDRYTGLSDDEYMAIVKDYIAWSQDLGQRGLYAGGHKLTDEPGRTLTRGNGGIDVHDSPATELAEILGGVIIVNANDYDAAVEIAKTCPHLVHNDKIEIRQIDEAAD